MDEITQNATWVPPIQPGDVPDNHRPEWDGEKWEFIPMQYVKHLEQQTLTYKELRQLEYPPMSDYLDGIVKGDQAQVDKYIAECQVVKAKYPKPIETQ